MVQSASDAGIEKKPLVEYVRKWGGSTADALLDYEYNQFSLPGLDGIIPYRLEFGCAVVFGDPLCAPDDSPVLALAFHEFCKEKKWQVIYVIVSQAFAEWAIKNVSEGLVEYGKEYFIDPFSNPVEKHGPNACLVRKKIKHASSKHIIIKEYQSQIRDPELEKALENVSIQWLTARKGPQIHTANLRLFKDRLGKRWFYAQQDNEMIGVLTINELQAQHGWLITHLMVKPQAQTGTSEMLVIAALDVLRSENCHYTSFGEVPAKKLCKMIGFSKTSSWLISLLYQLSRIFFRLEGHHKFWEKFDPESKPSYLLFSKPKIGINEIRALAKVMNVSL